MSTSRIILVSLVVITGVAMIIEALSSQKISETASAPVQRSAAPALPGAAAGITVTQRAYLATCNNFAWKGDRVRCETCENNTLKIYQEMRPAEG